MVNNYIIIYIIIYNIFLLLILDIVLHLLRKNINTTKIIALKKMSILNY